jgi:hypothetical protein
MVPNIFSMLATVTSSSIAATKAYTSALNSRNCGLMHLPPLLEELLSRLRETPEVLFLVAVFCHDSKEQDDAKLGLEFLVVARSRNQTLE